MSLRTIVLAAAACAAATAAMTAATPAFAADILVAPERVTVRISYADLNLASAAGRARLERRIAAAARGICDSGFPVGVQALALARECRADAIASVRMPAMLASNGGARGLAGSGVNRAAN